MFFDMRILILGGTGAMGVHLVELLAKTEYNVTVTSRCNRKSEFANVNYINGDAMDIDFILSVLTKKWDVIIDFMSYTTEEFGARADLFLKSATQYIFLSSSRVYADDNSFITETSDRLLDISTDKEYLQTDEYALAKAKQENLLMKSCYKNWTIIRPYITYAENRLQLGVLEKEHWLYRAINGKTIIFASDINSKFTTLTYGFDVARGIMAIIGKQEALSQSFHITSNKAIKWNDALIIYLNVLEEYLGYRPKVLLVSHNELVNLGYSKYQVKYDRMYDRRFENNKISQFINVDEFLDVKEGLELSLRTFLKEPTFGTICWGIEARKDKLSKELFPIKKINGVRNKLAYLVYRYTNLKK